MLDKDVEEIHTLMYKLGSWTYFLPLFDVVRLVCNFFPTVLWIQTMESCLEAIIDFSIIAGGFARAINTRLAYKTESSTAVPAE